MIFFFNREKLPPYPLLKCWKNPLCTYSEYWALHSPLLKKFCRRNLKYNTSTNQKSREAPLLKIFLHALRYQFFLTLNKSHHALEHLGNHKISNSNSIIHLKKPTQSLSNPLAITSPSQMICTFLLYFPWFNSILTCLSDPAQY